jgi:hypothetical protein
LQSKIILGINCCEVSLAIAGAAIVPEPIQHSASVAQARTLHKRGCIRLTLLLQAHCLLSIICSQSSLSHTNLQLFQVHQGVSVDVK